MTTQLASRIPARKPTAPVQKLVIAAGADEFGLELNRHRIGMYPLNAGICEPLVRLSRDFRVKPALATRWELRGDNTWRFTLRSGVRFHDGSPLTASSVKYSVDLGVRKRTEYSFLSDKSVQVVDDSTVDITPARSNLRLLEQLVHPTYSIIADGSDPVRPVCTGPFRLAKYLPEDRLTVERNEEYWGEKPLLQQIIFRFIPDDNTRALALRAGEVHAIFDVNRGMVASLQSSPGITIVAAPPGGVILLYIATRGRAPFTLLSDAAVRRAVALAIDRRALVQQILDGHAKEIRTVNPPAVLGDFASVVTGIPHDPGEAGRTLEAAGWKLMGDAVRARNGQRLTLTMLAQPGSVDRAVAQYVQAQLAEAGMEVQIVQLDAAAWTSRINAGTFDLDIEVPNQNDANPSFLLALRWYSKSNTRSARFMPAGSLFDSLVDVALAVPESNDARRMAAEAMHELVDRQVAAIPLAGIYRIYAMSDRVQGFQPHPSKTNQWWSTVWLAK